MTQLLPESVDSAFQLIGLDGAVDGLVETADGSRASSPTPTELEEDDDSMVVTADAVASDAADASMDAAAHIPAAAGLVATDESVGSADVPIIAVTSAPTYGFVCHDLDENRAGIALGVVPYRPLVAGDLAHDAHKYYAVARGRFIGVFDDSSMYVLAVGKVSNPLCMCPETLGAALNWFNKKLAMGLCQIVN
ncbi:hypothetical protein BD626DRAFT_570397 [Schizophyllum amplum]|uniref:Uncharacterized protein n=1 Tax=Schizophyllum amplum TaxID=97359 RepID=A0A550CA67_9AGAR|nr:hypothetical protein BD626DRAFT_570397 [Auriculariopsis ampla]